MSDQIKPPSPLKPRGKTLAYLQWCDKKVEHSQRIRWIKVLESVSFDYKKCLYDEDTHESICSNIFAKLSQKRELIQDTDRCLMTPCSGKEKLSQV